jgi:hypothetical protein
MPLYKFLRNLLNVLEQIENKMGVKIIKYIVTHWLNSGMIER